MLNDFYEIDVDKTTDCINYELHFFIKYSSDIDILFRFPDNSLDYCYSPTNVLSSFVDKYEKRIMLKYKGKLTFPPKKPLVGSCVDFSIKSDSSFFLKIGHIYYIRIERPCVYV